MARDARRSSSARRLASRARATPLLQFVGLSLVVHSAALGWLARERFAPVIASEPPRVRFQLRLASAEASPAMTEAPLEDELRPREVQIKRQRAPQDAPPPRPVTDRAALDRAALVTPAPRAEAPLGRVARAETGAATMAPPRQAIEPRPDGSAPQRVECGVPLATPSPPVAGADAPSVASAASDGEAQPDPLHSPQPEYPRLARLRGWEGSCMLLARVGADGRVLELTVLESSGRKVLDEAALEGVRRWRFEPARARGRAVESTARIPVTFRIRR